MHRRPYLSTLVCILMIGNAAAAPLFIDKTAELGLEPANSPAAWIDFNNDGWTDLATSGVLWQNNNGTSFTRVPTDNIFADPIWADFDNDGLTDVYCVGAKRLYRNAGDNKFEPIELPDLPTKVSLGACWADFNGDAFVDLYIGGYEVWPGEEFPDIILINKQGRSFDLAWTQKTIRRARGITACDFDTDGDIDVYVSNYRLQPNLLLQNDSNAIFTDIAVPAAVAGDGGLGAFGHTIGSAWGDLDNDGLFDLFVGNFSHPPDYQDRPKFYKNLGPQQKWTFEDKSPTAKLRWQESYASPALADYDNDGDIDLYFTTVYGGNHPVLYRNEFDPTDSNTHFRFTETTEPAGLANLGSTYQAAFADFDNDGDLDLITNGKLFVNQTTDRHYLKVRLRGDGKSINQSAIGAQISIKLDNQTLTRQVEAATGQGNQNDLTLHFGLAAQTAPLNLKILWPNAHTQTIDNIKPDQTITFDSPAANHTGE